MTWLVKISTILVVGWNVRKRGRKADTLLLPHVCDKKNKF